MHIKRLNGIYRGDTKAYKFNFPGVDITAWTIWMTLKIDEGHSDAAASLQVSSTAGDSVNDDPINGIMYVTIPSDLCATLQPGKYFYDFQRVVDGTPPDVRTLLAGEVEIYTDITLAT